MLAESLNLIGSMFAQLWSFQLPFGLSFGGVIVGIVGFPILFGFVYKFLSGGSK